MSRMIRQIAPARAIVTIRKCFGLRIPIAGFLLGLLFVGYASAQAPRPPQRSANFQRARPLGPADTLPPPAAGTQPATEPTPAAGTQPATEPDSTRRVRLGAVVDTPPIIAAPGRPAGRPRGAWVTEVLPQSPAEAAGLRVGDLIVAVQGRVITSVRDLMDELEQWQPGDELRFQYAREHALEAVAVTLAGSDGLAPQAAATAPTPNPSGQESGVLSGIGSMFGGLLGGQNPPPQPPAPAPSER